MAKSEKTVIKEIIEGFLNNLGIKTGPQISIEEDEVKVVLDTSEEGGMLIGYHGENLEALQLLLGIALYKRLQKFVRVSADVGDYKKQRIDFLTSLALQAKERVIREQQESLLPNLKPWERRVVHLLFQSDEEVASESVGEGKERTLVIKPKKK